MQASRRPPLSFQVCVRNRTQWSQFGLCCVSRRYPIENREKRRRTKRNSGEGINVELSPTDAHVYALSNDCRDGLHQMQQADEAGSDWAARRSIQSPHLLLHGLLGQWELPEGDMIWRPVSETQRLMDQLPASFRKPKETLRLAIRFPFEGKHSWMAGTNALAPKPCSKISPFENFKARFHRAEILGAKASAKISASSCPSQPTSHRR